MRRLALVTGASAGIGAEFARAYARRGFDVALTARRADRLEKLAAEITAAAHVDALVRPGDLADTAFPAKLIEMVGRPVDVLVNNAGYGLAGTFTETTWAEQAAFIQVMATAPTELAHRVLPGMTERGHGRIINVSSLAGLIPAAQGTSLYGAVKAYLIKVSQALNADFAAKGVFVTALCPGFTRSEFHEAAGLQTMAASIPAALWQTAREVVESGIRANESNAAVFVPGVANKAIAGAARLIPDGLGAALMRGGAPGRGAAD